MIRISVEVETGVEDDVPLIAPPLMRRTVRALFQRAEVVPPKGASVLVDLSLVGEESMRGLNRDHRGVDEVTDVLAFPLMSPDELKTPSENAELAGDIVICPSYAARNADAYGHSSLFELAFLSGHGTLHLLGWDHQDEDALEEMNRQTFSALGVLLPPNAWGLKQS